MDGFIGEIRPFAFGFVPQNWLECNGQTLSIQQNAALFAVIGIAFGGNGQTTFNLPDLLGQTAVGLGTAPGNAIYWNIGEKNGTEQVALNTAQIPSHNHTLTMEQVAVATVQSTTATPTANSSWLSHPVQVVDATTAYNIPNLTKPATGVAVDSTLDPRTIGPTGSGAGHENRQPYLALTYCICNNGEFPARS